MLSWQPHPPILSGVPRPVARSCSRDVARGLSLPDQTGVFTVPAPDELACPAQRSLELLSELVDIDILRRPLIHELSAMLRRLGADERELLGLARALWEAQARRRDEAKRLELADVPVPRPSCGARPLPLDSAAI